MAASAQQLWSPYCGVAPVPAERLSRWNFDPLLIAGLAGIALAWHVGYSLWEGWLVLSILLYLVTGAFWLPVVWMQARMRDLATEAAAAGAPLPARYHSLFRLWFAFGFPAFAAVVGIFWLMISRPSLEWFTF